jgi:hypothetical protein
LIEANPQFFESVIRPFSHDIALIRSRKAFALNLKLGWLAARRHFQRVARFYLPPEFMLSSGQVELLAESGVESVFVNAHRLTTEMRRRIPVSPYWVRGIGGSQLRCIPVQGALTQDYLNALHRFDVTSWNKRLAISTQPIAVSWRDGETAILFPNGLEREEYWLSHESGVERRFLTEVEFEYSDNQTLDPSQLRSYPVHSFQSWMKEFRMMGYLGRLERLECEVEHFSAMELGLWLQAINSDVLSAIEKRAVVVDIRTAPSSVEDTKYTLLRSERGFEGEEFLELLERTRLADRAPLEKFLASSQPHATKLRGRLEYLQHLQVEQPSS